MHCSEKYLYSITSSAVASSVVGIVRPSILAVLRLMTRSNLIDARLPAIRAALSLPPENFATVDAGLPISVGDTGSVAHQATRVDILTLWIDCGKV